ACIRTPSTFTSSGLDGPPRGGAGRYEGCPRVYGNGACPRSGRRALPRSPAWSGLRRRTLCGAVAVQALAKLIPQRERRAGTEPRHVENGRRAAVGQGVAPAVEGTADENAEPRVAQRQDVGPRGRVCVRRGHRIGHLAASFVRKHTIWAGSDMDGRGPEDRYTPLQ